MAEDINKPACSGLTWCSDDGGCSFAGVDPGTELLLIWSGCSVAGVDDKEDAAGVDGKESVAGVDDTEYELLLLLTECDMAVAPCSLLVGPTLLIPTPAPATAGSRNDGVLLSSIASPGPGLGADVRLGAGEGEDLCCFDPLGQGPGEG